MRGSAGSREGRGAWDICATACEGVYIGGGCCRQGRAAAHEIQDVVHDLLPVCQGQILLCQKPVPAHVRTLLQACSLLRTLMQRYVQGQLRLRSS